MTMERDSNIVLVKGGLLPAVLLNFQGPYRSELRDFVVGDAVLEFGGAIELGIAPVTAAFGSSFAFWHSSRTLH